MYWKSHAEIEGSHATLSASKYAWIRYDDDKIMDTFMTRLDAMKGTQLHELAAHLIKMRVNLPDTTATFNSYVNDCIGFRMDPEVVLFASKNAFGTADAIRYGRNPKNPDRMLLQIFDLKTGVNPAKFDQLLIYVVFFIIEYKIDPKDIDIELRIYQNDEIQIYIPELDDIIPIRERLVSADAIIDRMRAEMFS